MLYRFLTISFALIFFCMKSAYAEPKQMTLREAIYLALAYNVSIENEELRRIADKFNLKVVYNHYQWQYGFAGNVGYTSSKVGGRTEESTSSALTPTANKTGVYGTTYSLNLTNPSNNGIYNPGINLSVTQPLMRGFGKQISLTPLYNAEDSELISRLVFKNSVIQVVTQVTNAYNTLIQAQNQVEISELTLKAYQQTIANVRANIKAGRQAETDVLQAESNYASELINLKGAKNSVLTSTRDLLNLIGVPPDKEIIIDKTPYSHLPEIPSQYEAYQTALENNIQYRSDLLSLESLRRALLVAKDEMRPAFNLTLNATTGGGSGRGINAGFESLFNNKNTSASAQLDFDVPIRNYSIKQNLINAQVQLAQAEINLSQELRTLKTTILNNIADTQTSIDQIDLSKKAIELQRKDQQQLNAKLRYGLASVFEVNTRQHDLAQAMNQLVNDQINYINSLTVLYANMGILLDVWQIDINY